VKAHGWKIGLVSEKGRGSTFEIVIPRRSLSLIQESINKSENSHE